MKTITITPPEGYEIDKEKSTFECIVFKPIKKQLPKTLEELKDIKGHLIDGECRIWTYVTITSDDNRNLYLTKAQAESSIVLAQLTQLREVYRQGWKPNSTNDKQVKYGIILFSKNLQIDEFYLSSEFLSFQSEEIAQEFLTNFKDLIIQAAPLLFGEEI